MNKTAKSRRKQMQRRDRRKELAELISEAEKQPGIQQVMDVYQRWQPFEAAARAHQRFFGIQRVVVVSNSSAGSALGSN